MPSKNSQFAIINVNGLFVKVVLYIYIYISQLPIKQYRFIGWMDVKFFNLLGRKKNYVVVVGCIR